jgi:hypothetical protein
LIKTISVLTFVFFYFPLILLQLLRSFPYHIHSAPQSGHQGTWIYDDPNFQKLTDGIYGVDDWTSTQGAEWVGWWGIEWDGTTDSNGNPIVTADHYNVRNIQLDFVFQPGVSISSVVLGTNQDAIYNWNVVFPSYIEIISGGNTVALLETPFSLDNSGNDNGYNNGKRHEVIFNFDPLMTQALTIILNNEYNFNNYASYGINWDNSPGSPYNGMFWIFLDEVDFYDEHQPVPEPSTILLASLGLPAIMVFGRRKRKI